MNNKINNKIKIVIIIKNNNQIILIIMENVKPNLLRKILKLN